MSRLQPLGFFRELPYGDAEGPALKDAVRAMPAEFERDAVTYLRNAVLVASAPMLSQDVLAPSVSIGTPSLLTDGIWIWPSDLAYYVEKYHCELPRQFVDHMRSRNWRPPLKQEIDVNGIPADIEDENDIMDVEKIDG